MRLQRIAKKTGIQPTKIVVPSNSGLRDMTPDPFQILGIEKKDRDVYTDASGVEVIRKRGEDIAQMCDWFTEKGIAVFGVTGDDLYDEYRWSNPTDLRVVDTIDWIIPNPGMYSRPTLCLIGPEGSSITDINERSEIIANRKYKTSSQMLMEELAEDLDLTMPQLRYLNGSTESEIPQRADYGIEIVVSGNTLSYTDSLRQVPRDPKLVVLQELRQSDMSVITSWPGGFENNLRLQYRTIQRRLQNPSDSVTSALLQSQNSLVKKIGEENAELIVSVASQNKTNFLEELQQSVGWLPMVAAVSLGVTENEYFEALRYE